MIEFLWRMLARIVSRPAVVDWLIRRAQRTPYTPIRSREGDDIYMHRWWLFNGYAKDSNDVERAPRPWLPSIRVHHIVRPDDDDHHHDHPWDARTIILRGAYIEERPALDPGYLADDAIAQVRARHGDAIDVFSRSPGYTGPVKFESYHRISDVSRGGVYTLWFTWRYQGMWGFLVNGVKVPWREYLGVNE